MKGIIKTCSAILAVITMTACSTLERADYTVTRVAIPPQGETQTSELGDTLILKGLEQTADSIRFITPLKTNAMMFKSIIEAPPQVLRPAFKGDNEGELILALTKCHKASGLFANGSEEMKEFCPPPTDIGDLSLVTDMTIPTFLYRPNAKCKLFLTAAECVDNNVVFEKAIYRAYVPDSFKKELVYNGRLENYVKIIYREYLNDWARPAFTQELQYDLNESNIIGFQGARLEIIDATNTNIRYRVLTHFPDN
jgi:hypothetical protein